MLEMTYVYNHRIRNTVQPINLRIEVYENRWVKVKKIADTIVLQVGVCKHFL